MESKIDIFLEMDLFEQNDRGDDKNKGNEKLDDHEGPAQIDPGKYFGFREVFEDLCGIEFRYEDSWYDSYQQTDEQGKEDKRQDQVEAQCFHFDVRKNRLRKVGDQEFIISICKRPDWKK